MRKINRLKKTTGFTLVEIMVVVVIIGVLTGLMVPKIIKQADKSTYEAAKADVRAIKTALDLYRLDNRNYPSTAQGLRALVEKPDGNPSPVNWLEGGYLPKYPVDQWGNEYVYISPATDEPYELISLAADGRQGGEGYDADLNSMGL